MQSFTADGAEGFTFANYTAVLTEKGFLQAAANSLLVSACSALITTVLAFILAYTIHYTNAGRRYKSLIAKAAVLPMLLPTITYGFAIIYSFGKQGLLTRLFGRQLFDIYGFNGLLLGYVIYTLPISFMLINNTMGYIDKKFTVVSRLMGDTPVRTFWMTVLQPLLGTLAASFIQTFFLCFTDFGIPASVGGSYEVIASVLYTEMLGSVPNFGNGAVVALVMLVPSVVSITVLTILERYNVRYSKISQIELKKNRARDTVFSGMSALILIAVFSVFLVMFLVPFVDEWPYRMSFTMEHVRAVFADSTLFGVYINSVIVALVTALAGTLVSYGAALVTARSSVNGKLKRVIESIALITNTIPGMVIGLAYLFCFSGTGLQNTFAILIICNMVHFFSTPYLMMKSSLSKMNGSWETTAMLMGDNWVKTIIRVVTPNAVSGLLEVFSYYFVNAMVTVSAVIFLAGARTMLVTTKIKELQYFNQYNEIFVLSLLILFTNMAGKFLFQKLADYSQARQNSAAEAAGAAGIRRKLTPRRTAAVLAAAAVAAVGIGAGIAGGSGSGEEQVVIYSNADDEAVQAMKNALDENGYAGEYIFQTFGTSELGGKLLAEGKNIEADLLTMSTFYIDSAQEQNEMFRDLEFEVNTLDEFPSYCAPITAQEGTILVNTEMLKENGLPMPESLKDLADSVYSGYLSVTDLSSSSTAWLLVQGLISEYGADGLPVDYVDPQEGNFSLTESVAVVDKGADSNAKAMEMARCIIENGREELQTYYPLALYEGETTDAANISANPKVFEEPLTVDLLEEHQELSEACK